MKICIIGANPLGFQTAYDILRTTNNEVLVFDKVKPPITELEDIMRQADSYALYAKWWAKGTKRVKSNIAYVTEVPDADVYWFCLETYLNPEGGFSLREFEWVINKVNGIKMERNHIVINSSVVPTGINVELAKKSLGEQYRIGYAYVPDRNNTSNTYNHNWNIRKYVGVFNQSPTRVRALLETIYNDMPRESKYLNVNAVELIKLSDVLYRSTVIGFMDEISMIAQQYDDQNNIITAVHDIITEHHNQSYPVVSTGTYPSCGAGGVNHFNVHAFIGRKISLTDSILHSSLKLIQSKNEFVVKRIVSEFRNRLSAKDEPPTIEVYGLTSKANGYVLEKSSAKSVALKLAYERVWSQAAGKTVNVFDHLKLFDPLALSHSEDLPDVLKSILSEVNSFTYQNKPPSVFRVLLVDHDCFELDKYHGTFDLIFAGKYYRG